MSLSPALRRRATLAAPLLWMAVVFAGSSLHGKGTRLPRHWDKVAHALEYAVLGFLAQRALRELSLPASRATVLAAAACLAYGVTDELHQSFVPGRDADARDVAADALGGLAGSVAAALTSGAARRRGAPGG